MSTPIVPWKTAAATLSVGIATEGWNLAEQTPEQPEAPRGFSVWVSFAEPFNSIPVVQAAISGFDLDQRDSARLSLRVGQVSTDGFLLDLWTWRETRVYSVDVSWIAIGA